MEARIFSSQIGYNSFLFLRPFVHLVRPSVRLFIHSLCRYVIISGYILLVVIPTHLIEIVAIT